MRKCSEKVQTNWWPWQSALAAMPDRFPKGQTNREWPPACFLLWWLFSFPFIVYFPLATKAASGRPEVCFDFIHCLIGGSQGPWRRKLYAEGAKRQAVLDVAQCPSGPDLKVCSSTTIIQSSEPVWRWSTTPKITLYLIKWGSTCINKTHL